MTNNFISGSSIRNFILNDPLVDWLEYMHKKGYKDYVPNPTPFQDELFKEGKDFEDKIVSYLKERYPNTMKSVASVPEDLYDKDKLQQTKLYMSEEVPIISQGVLVDEQQQVGGICDLLIRSDFLNKICVDHNGTCRVETTLPPHYVVLDIKLSRLSLKSDGYHVKNSRNFAYYKGQLFIYNEALKSMQAHSSNSAYIIGRGWEYTKGGEKIYGSNCFERLGFVDFSNEDEFIKHRVDAAVSWIRRLRHEGESWVLFPPSVEELRPNMSVDGGKWSDAKTEIAKKHQDVTLLPFCGHTKRKVATRAGVTTWKKCASEILQVKSEKRKKSIDRSIRVNKKERFDIIPKRLSNLIPKEDTVVELYVDYETFYKRDEMVGINAGECRTVIFLVGCGFVKSGVWNYKSFVLDEIGRDNENKLFDEVLKEIGSEEFRLYSWGTTEKILYEKLTGDHSLFSEDKYIDLLKVFRDHSISMKGCFSYSLKDIARALHKEGHISTIWRDDSSVKNGYEAMKEGEKLFLGDKSKLNELLQYNEIDCRIMWEIVSFLRKN